VGERRASRLWIELLVFVDLRLPSACQQQQQQQQQRRRHGVVSIRRSDRKQSRQCGHVITKESRCTHAAAGKNERQTQAMQGPCSNPPPPPPHPPAPRQAHTGAAEQLHASHRGGAPLVKQAPPPCRRLATEVSRSLVAHWIVDLTFQTDQIDLPPPFYLPAGVRWHTAAQKWATALWDGSSSRYLGVFEDKKDAARAYDKEAKKLFVNPVLNFLPDGSLNPDRHQRFCRLR
jgi:hypothetical protein